MVALIIFQLAQLLFSVGNYSDSLPLLNSLVLEVSEADRPKAHFMRVVSAHQTFDRQTAQDSSDYLCESFRVDIPRRYEHVAWLIREDIKKWEDLGEIAGRMKEVENRLTSAKADKQTRQKQDKIVELLDKKIKDLEDAENKQNQQSAGNSSGSKPIEISKLPDEVGGNGIVDDKQLKKKLENWGNLPQSERIKIEQQITRNLPAKYRSMIENYFKELNK